jgi:hypothetical protein
VKPIVWRETSHVLVSQRSRSYARAHGCSLEVLVWCGRPKPPRVTGDDRIVATVEFRRTDGCGWEQVDRRDWPDASAATLVEARKWCETTAADFGVRA